jgi:hypothetical protein
MSRAVFVAALICATAAHAEARFFSGIDDLPLAPGLSEGQSFQFDESGGRITGATASGRTTPAAVRAFYAETLPSLGWSSSPNGESREMVFLRGRERLTLTITAAGSVASLDVRLLTRPAAMNDD